VCVDVRVCGCVCVCVCVCVCSELEEKILTHSPPTTNPTNQPTNQPTNHESMQVDVVEAKIPQVEDAEATVAEKQRELAQAFSQGAQFAGWPDVRAPQRAAKGLAASSSRASGAKAAGGGGRGKK
jgi:hypothetical protein